jgi:hypothetical protein
VTRAAKTGERTTACEVRTRLHQALHLDLIGPSAGDPGESELLSQSPSRWYLTGFLVPKGAAPDQRIDEESGEQVAEEPLFANADDAAAPEPQAARRASLPSSVGVSVLVSADTRSFTALVDWADYERQEVKADEGDVPEDDVSDGEPREGEAPEAGALVGELPEVPLPAAGDGPAPAGRRVRTVWRRVQRSRQVELPLPVDARGPVEFAVPESRGIVLVVSIRPVRTDLPGMDGLPAGTRAISVFVVNSRIPAERERRDQEFAFQVQLTLTSPMPLIARPSVAGLAAAEWDDRVADLQYRDCREYAVGHGIATMTACEPDGSCRSVQTTWLPTADVERVAPAQIDGVELGMEALAGLADAASARTALGPLIEHYRSWIARSHDAPVLPETRRLDTARALLDNAAVAAARIERGVACLEDPAALLAFRHANRAMAMQGRRRAAIQQHRSADEVDPPRWRPFQLAFVLLNLPGIVDPRDAEREAVDLLFFPTGGGKTEAYLGLAAFVLVLRRLRQPGLCSAGVAVIMRYTLRLLTLDQLNRATALICALELIRQEDPAALGPWPFEIGLWVGDPVTPNRMGSREHDHPKTARARTLDFQRNERNPAPIPLEECPWCGTQFSRNSFRLLPNPDQPTDLRIGCANRHCDFSGDQALPVVAVDEPIYRRLPCFLIATVDKFAALPWTGEVGAFTGRVDRADAHGFYGACAPGRGRPLERGSLLPPDLIIQDELHLISGPLGTVAGLYESALDELCVRREGGVAIRPKIIASTATVRRADRQIRALFNRSRVEVFPPPGPDRRDSFFAVTHDPGQSHPRLYVGIAAQGRSPKVVLLRTYLALLAAAQKDWLAAGGAHQEDNSADPYMTLVGYFNSLRELGGSRRIVEDEVGTRLARYARRRRVGETEGLFADRRIAYEVVELTSRVGTGKVAEARRRLGVRFGEKGAVDVAIATNMISVGLDILRLGLMVVFGQPKTTAEYIQATSRVGRDAERPGLVVTLFNVHKARDRSHYERFASYHESFYRGVEATSVTPFAPRALDRALAAVVVGFARHGIAEMTPPDGATAITTRRADLEYVAQALADRAASHDGRQSSAEASELRTRVRTRILDLLDSWEQIATAQTTVGAVLQYQREFSRGAALLHYPLDPELATLPRVYRKFRANRSMRDVEPEVNLWMRTLDNLDVEGAGEEQP